jgi:hypothetical protein
MSDHPVQLEVVSPTRFDRIQLLLRILFATALAWFGITAGWLIWLLYVMLPVIASVALSTDRARYHADFAPRLWRVLEWLLQLSAFMMLLTDRFPTGADDNVRIAIRYTGKPAVGSAIARLLTSIPSGIVLAALWCVSAVVWPVAAIMVVVAARVPASLLAFQRGVLRWQARLVAYHASLVDDYPPFSFDSVDDSGALAAPATR